MTFHPEEVFVWILPKIVPRICLHDIILWACRFLELAQLHANQDDDSALFHYQVQGSYDSELMQLQESFQGKIVHLLSDTVSLVSHLMITSLGKNNTVSVLLSTSRNRGFFYCSQSSEDPPPPLARKTIESGCGWV